MFKNMSIRNKIWIAIAIPVCIIIVSLVISTISMNSIVGGIQTNVHQQGMESLDLILNADRDMYQALNIIQGMSTENPNSAEYKELANEYREEVNQARNRILEAESILMENEKLWDKYTHTGTGRKIFYNFNMLKEKFSLWMEELETLISSGNLGAMYETNFFQNFNSAREHMDEIGETVKFAIESEIHAYATSKNTTLSIIIVLTIIGLAIVAFVSLKIISNITGPLKEAEKLLTELSKGHLGYRIDLHSEDEIGNMIKTMNTFADNLKKELVDVMIQISEGDLSKSVMIAGEKDEIGPAIKKIMDSLKELINETDRLTEAAKEGDLTVRGNYDNLKGAYADIVKGVNNTLDEVIEPIEEAKYVLGKMAVNDYTTGMSDKYKGTLKEFAEDLNKLRSTLLYVQQDLISASVGDMSRSKEIEKYGQLSENDKLLPSVLAVYHSIDGIINEVNMLTKSALEGELSVRGDVNKFKGGYRDIIDGFNKTIDAIVAPIEEAACVLQELASGNLTETMKGEYKGDHANIKNSMNMAIESFNKLLGDIRNSSEQVALSAHQLSSSSQTLSQGSTEQASSIEEVTSSMEEISAQTNNNATNANEANKLAEQAKEYAQIGNNKMKEMINSMAEINESSSNISKIIKVIDEIAFQTNILALNAAVEAARAGQYGKGFAVVAEEVRNLAARSADAAKETTAMIENSIERVEYGTKITNDTAEALESIVESVENAACLVSEIAAASNEQASGIAQINQAIMQVSQVIQTNSATAEEGASASEELSGQAELLNKMVRKFKINTVSRRIDELDSETLNIINSLKNNTGYEEKASNKEINLKDEDFGKY